jgi:hypothetical protein
MSTSSHNEICSGMNATNNYLLKYTYIYNPILFEKQGDILSMYCMVCLLTWFLCTHIMSIWFGHKMGCDSALAQQRIKAANNVVAAKRSIENHRGEPLAGNRSYGWVRHAWSKAAASASSNKRVTPGFKAKPDAHRMYAQDQVVIHTVRM